MLSVLIVCKQELSEQMTSTVVEQMNSAEGVQITSVESVIILKYN